MKKKFSILLFASLVLGTLGSCGPKGLPEEYSLMKFWAGNPSEEVYAVSETDTETKIQYTDATGELNGGWEYVSRSFSYDSADVAKFSEYNKITFTGKLETTSGSNVVMVKVEGEGGTFEKKFNFSSDVSTYEFGLNFVTDWTKVSSLLFFVNRETSESGSGLITLTKFALSKAAIVDEYNIAAGMPSVPQDWNTYNGGEEFKVDYRWGYDATEEITTTELENKQFKFSWNVMEQEWNYVSAMVKGSDTNLLSESGFKRINFKVIGTAGAHILFKFQTKDNVKAKEVWADLTGEEQEVEVDVTEVLAASTNDQYLVCIFPYGGQKGADLAGEMTLKEAKFDKTNVYVEPKTNKTSFASILIKEFDMVDSCYTVTSNGDVLTVALNKTETGWQSIQARVKKTEDWFNLGDYKRLYAVISSSKNTHIMIKPYDSQEFKYELLAGQEIVVDETITVTADETKVTPIFISMDDGDALDAVVTIKYLQFAKQETNIVTNGEAYITKRANNESCYTVTSTQTGMVVDYLKDASGYQSIEFLVSSNFDKLSILSATVTSNVNTHVLFKPADNGVNEHRINLEANVPQEVEFAFTPNTDATWGCKHVLFVCTDEGDATSGTVTFENFKVMDAAKLTNYGDFGSITLTKFYRADSCYNIIPTDQKSEFEVRYNKQASGWESFAAHLALTEDWYGFENYTKISVELVSDVTVSVLLKAYDNGAGEKWVNLEANVPQIVEYHVDASLASSGADFIVFICAGDNAGATSGSVFFNGLRVMREGANVEHGGSILIDSLQPKNNLNITKINNGMDVEYTEENVGFDACEFYLASDNIHRFTYVTLDIVSNVNTHVLLKPFDNGANEKSIELVANVPQTIGYSLSYVPEENAVGQWGCKQILFFATTAGDALTGTVTFTNFQYQISL